MAIEQEHACRVTLHPARKGVKHRKISVEVNRAVIPRQFINRTLVIEVLGVTYEVPCRVYDGHHGGTIKIPTQPLGPMQIVATLRYEMADMMFIDVFHVDCIGGKSNVCYKATTFTNRTEPYRNHRMKSSIVTPLTDISIAGVVDGFILTVDKDASIECLPLSKKSRVVRLAGNQVQITTNASSWDLRDLLTSEYTIYVTKGQKGSSLYGVYLYAED